MDTELECSSWVNGSHTAPNWPNCLCCLHYNSLVMAPKSVFWYQIGSNTELAQPKLFIYFIFWKSCLMMWRQDRAAPPLLPARAWPWMQPSGRECSFSTHPHPVQMNYNQPNSNSNPDADFDIKSVQTHSKHAILPGCLGTTDTEVEGELNVHIPGCPQTQRQKNETKLLHCNGNLLAVGKASSQASSTNWNANVMRWLKKYPNPSHLWWSA